MTSPLHFPSPRLYKISTFEFWTILKAGSRWQMFPSKATYHFFSQLSCTAQHNNPLNTGHQTFPFFTFPKPFPSLGKSSQPTLLLDYSPYANGFCFCFSLPNIQRKQLPSFPFPGSCALSLELLVDSHCFPPSMHRAI